jgi:hypothetical protein
LFGDFKIGAAHELVLRTIFPLLQERLKKREAIKMRKKKGEVIEATISNS